MIERYVLGYGIFFTVVWLVYVLCKSADTQTALIRFGAPFALLGAVAIFGPAAAGQNDLNAQISGGVFRYLIIAPLGIIGAGFMTGALLKRYAGYKKFQIPILVLPIIIGVIPYQMEQHRIQTKENFQAAMELTNVSGMFGAHPVTVPVSPFVSLATRCKVPPRESSAICRAVFSQSNTFWVFHGFNKTDLDFSFVSVRTPDADCRRKYECVELQTWCARRTDLEQSAWCWSEHQTEIRFRNDAAHHNEEDEGIPLLKQSNPAEGFRIRCRPKFSNRVFCKAHFDVATGIRTIISIWDIEPGREEATALEVKAHAERLWAEMTSNTEGSSQ